MEASELLAAAVTPEGLEAMVVRRESGEPMAWIVGTTTFCGRSIRVHPGVFVPRPQTEDLARRAAALLGPGDLAVDLCTGSGAVAAHLAAVPGARVVATDLDPRAVACARANGVAAVLADLAAPLRPSVAAVVTAVAPYVPTAGLGLLPADVVAHEPPLALDGGPDGLAVLTRVVTAAAGLLRPGGHLLVEAGGAQEEPLRALMAEAGLVETRSWSDEEGDLRGLLARRPR